MALSIWAEERRDGQRVTERGMVRGWQKGSKVWQDQDVLVAVNTSLVDGRMCRAELLAQTLRRETVVYLSSGSGEADKATPATGEQEKHGRQRCDMRPVWMTTDGFDAGHSRSRLGSACSQK